MLQEQGALQFFRSDLIIFPAPSPSHLKKKELQDTKKITKSPPWPTRPRPKVRHIVPPGVTNAEINIANEPPSSPDLPDEAPAANLFGRSHGIAQNKRMSILREKSDHTPARKKRGDTARRASSLNARIVIQETLAADMSTLHVGDSLDARE
jgi:hypothetical protein